MAHDDKNFFMRHKILTVILVLLGLMIIGSALGEPTVTNTPNVETTTNPPAAKKEAPKAAKVGSTINISGNMGVAVQLIAVTDPAPPENEYVTAEAGKRLVAVKMKITNNGEAVLDDNTNNTTSISASDNQTYTTALYGTAGCTNFNMGSIKLAVGASTTGCVTFEVPNGVKVTKVHFTPGSGLSSDTGEWSVN